MLKWYYVWWEWILLNRAVVLGAYIAFIECGEEIIYNNGKFEIISSKVYKDIKIGAKELNPFWDIIPYLINIKSK